MQCRDNFPTFRDYANVFITLPCRGMGILKRLVFCYYVRLLGSVEIQNLSIFPPLMDCCTTFAVISPNALLSISSCCS